jgi:hypothetical protein
MLIGHKKGGLNLLSPPMLELAGSGFIRVGPFDSSARVRFHPRP